MSTEVNLHPAPFTNRFLAFFLESLAIGFVAHLLVTVFAPMLTDLGGGDGSFFFNDGNPFREAATLTLTTVIWLWMRVHCEMRGKATFGKKISGIKPIYFGAGPTLGRVLIRNIWLVAHLINMAVVWPLGLLGNWGPLESASLFAWVLLVAFTCLFDKRNRSLADRLGSSGVCTGVTCPVRGSIGCYAHRELERELSPHSYRPCD